MMVISDHVDWISHYLVELLQENNDKLFLAYSFRPSKTSFLLSSAEWRLCHFGTKSIDQFRKHLSTDEEHANEEMRLPASRKRSIKENRRSRVADFDRKGKRTKYASPGGS
ncbi:hypothetical protein YC2023_030030 [Brassica napus]